jgi:hypothetical protein
MHGAMGSPPAHLCDEVGIIRADFVPGVHRNVQSANACVEGPRSLEPQDACAYPARVASTR